MHELLPARKIATIAAIAALALFSLSCLEREASAQVNEEMKTLEMFYKDKDLVVTPSRDPKPISQVAENITVVTAKEIEAMQAHTVAEVLNYIPGIHLQITGGPGTSAYAHIQGSEFRHVRVLVDGVTVNNLSENFADIGSIPVQHIQRIEIIKGPASSAWGSSLGGVVNIITKSPDEMRRFGGMVSTSIGERTTGDFRGEISGTVESLGYYLSASGLTTDGLRPNSGVDSGNLYTKFVWDATDKARLTFTLGYTNGSRDNGVSSLAQVSQRESHEYLFSTLSLTYALTDTVDLDISSRLMRQNLTLFVNDLSGGIELNRSNSEDVSVGGSAKFSWRADDHHLVAGVDYDNGVVDSGILSLGQNSFSRSRQGKWALFLNDTIVFYDKLSLTPGVRYDHTSTNGDFVSPSLGITYNLTDTTFLRSYIARGFSAPPLSNTFGAAPQLLPNHNLGVERVWSYSVGLETTALKYLWLKTTFYRHDIDNLIEFSMTDAGFQAVNSGSQRRQGVEAELKTIPFLNTSLLAGFNYLDAKDLRNGETLKNAAPQTWDIGLQYDDHTAFSATLLGHYIWWNADAALKAKYSPMIWDLYLSRKIHSADNFGLEAFFSVRNLFNGSQYLVGDQQNPARWFEGGLRFRF